METERMPRITVGMAIYNAEATIRQCLSSISAQDFTDFEVIMLDDGSTDRSPQLLDDYAAQDKRFRAIHQKNAGVGAARNRIIDSARGQYLCFIDPDDWVEPTYLSDLVKEISDDSPNGIIIEGFKKFSQDGTCIDQTDDVDEHILKENFSQLFGPLKITERGHSCCKLYCMDTIRKAHLHFHENMPYFEDLLFLLEMLDDTDYIRIVPIKDYHYIFYTSSSSTRVHPFQKEYDVFTETERVILAKMNQYHLRLTDCPQTLHTLFVPFLRALKSDYHHPTSLRVKLNHLHQLCDRRTDFIKKYFLPDYKIEKLGKLLLVHRLYVPYVLLMHWAFSRRLQQMYYPQAPSR